MALSYVKLVYRLLDIVGDGSDAGSDPDAVALPVGTQITITPAVDRLVDPTSTPATTYYPQPIVCTLDSSGYLLDPQGQRGVYIADPTDQSIQPHDYTLGVRIAIPNRPAINVTAKLTQAAGDGSYDLALNSPMPQYVGDATSAASWAAAAAQSAQNAQDAADSVVQATWSTIDGKPAVVAEGATKAEARQSIGAGTSDLTLGTTSSTAAAGNRGLPSGGSDGQLVGMDGSTPAWVDAPNPVSYGASAPASPATGALWVEAGVAPTFAAVGSSGAVYYSTDGQTWSAASGGGGVTLRGVAWSPDLSLFAAVGSSGAVYYSTDGQTWTAGSGASDSLNAVAWSPDLGLFAAVGNSGAAYYSTDGQTWTAGSGAGGYLYAVAWSPDLSLFAAVGSSGAVYYSTDGQTWTAGSGASDSLNAVAWSPDLSLFAAVSTNAAYYSTDGQTWSAGSGAGGTLSSVAWSPVQGLFAAVGYSGAVYYSTDGQTWTAGSGASGDLNAVAWSPDLGLFAAVGYNGAAYYSTDGQTWSAGSGVGDTLIAVAWSPGTPPTLNVYDGSTWQQVGA